MFVWPPKRSKNSRCRFVSPTIRGNCSALYLKVLGELFAVASNPYWSITLGAEILKIDFLIELSFLHCPEKLKGYQIRSLVVTCTINVRPRARTSVRLQAMEGKPCANRSSRPRTKRLASWR